MYVIMTSCLYKPFVHADVLGRQANANTTVDIWHTFNDHSSYERSFGKLDLTDGRSYPGEAESRMARKQCSLRHLTTLLIFTPSTLATIRLHDHLRRYTVQPFSDKVPKP